MIYDAQTFLAVCVDPIFSKAITFILIERPTTDGLIRCLINYFNHLVAGNELKAQTCVDQKRLVQSTDKGTFTNFHPTN